MAILVFFCSMAWVAGWLVRPRRAAGALAYEESGELARSAVAEERDAIATELHDVVAHSVSIIAVQAGAAEQQLRPARPGPRAPCRGAAHRSRSDERDAPPARRAARDDTSYTPQPGLSASRI